jgi:glutamate synthase (NADPH/NADH) small chain
MDFLQSNTKNLLDGNHVDGCHLSAKNKDVIVIGGGDTGTDCVGTALRQGCRSLVQFEILNKPPETRAPDNPWPQWPKVYRLDYGQEEAAALFGRDPRTYSVMTKSFVGNNEGEVRAVRTVEINWSKDANESFRQLELAGTEREWPAQMVLLALGFEGPETEGLINQLGLELDKRGNVATDENKMTSVPNIFAAGDMARGQSLVVWAIGDGRQAARGADKFLMGETRRR